MAASPLDERIASLYRELPGVACRQCGSCCVSPASTLSECIYLLRYCIRTFPREKLLKRITAPCEIHPDHEGNLRCPFIENGRCGIHPGRTGACRLFGLPALKDLQIPNLTECPHGIGVTHGRGDIRFIGAWLKRLVALDAELYPFHEEPYMVAGFNIQCWLDIFFDETLTFSPFAQIREAMHGRLDLRFAAARWRPLTHLREKIDKITIMHSMLAAPEPSTLLPLLESIRDDYPLTGTYYRAEADILINALRRDAAPRVTL